MLRYIEKIQMTESVTNPQTSPSLPSTESVSSDELLEYRRGRRKTVLENNEHPISAGVFVAPDTEVMGMIEQETDGIVRYFPAHDLSVNESNRGLTSEPLYSRAVIRPLCHELIELYADKKIALRAIMTSVNGTLEGVMGEGIDMRDVADIISRGVEKDGEVFNVQGMAMNAGADMAAMGLKYISAYASKVGYELKCEAGAEGSMSLDSSESVFPAVIVYDAEALVATSHDRFSATFREGAKPEDAILGVYVLDKL